MLTCTWTGVWIWFLVLKIFTVHKKIFRTSSLILKLLKKILILFEIFCMSKDIHSIQKNLRLHWLQFFQKWKILQVEKYFLAEAKYFCDTIKIFSINIRFFRSTWNYISTYTNYLLHKINIGKQNYIFFLEKKSLCK